MKIRTYVLDGASEEAKAGSKYLAQLDLGEHLFMSFFGATKVEAVEKAETFYARERARALILEAGVVRVAAPSQNATSVIPSGSDHHFAGKVWVLNRATGDRARVPASELTSYEVRGYHKAGPRSK